MASLACFVSPEITIVRPSGRLYTACPASFDRDRQAGRCGVGDADRTDRCAQRVRDHSFIGSGHFHGLGVQRNQSVMLLQIRVSGLRSGFTVGPFRFKHCEDCVLFTAKSVLVLLGAFSVRLQRRRTLLVCGLQLSKGVLVRQASVRRVTGRIRSAVLRLVHLDRLDTDVGLCGREKFKPFLRVTVQFDLLAQRAVSVEKPVNQRLLLVTQSTSRRAAVLAEAVDVRGQLADLRSHVLVASPVSEELIADVLQSLDLLGRQLRGHAKLVDEPVRRLGHFVKSGCVAVRRERVHAEVQAGDLRVLGDVLVRQSLVVRGPDTLVDRAAGFLDRR
jgi:hypothetical protein